MMWRLNEWLEQLSDADAAVRARAVRRIARLGRRGLSPEDGLLVLKASSLPLAPSGDATDDPSAALLRAVLQVPYPEYLPAIVARFPHWNRRARHEALRGLMSIDDARAAEAVMTILRRHARDSVMPALPLGQHARHPDHAEVFFPELLSYLSVPRLAFSIAALTLSFAATCQFDPELLLPHAGRFLAMFRRRREWLGPRQRTEGIGWMWEQAYHSRRWQAGVLLDLLGHVPTADVEAELRRALIEFTDPRLRMGAALSLLRHEKAVDPETITEIAASPECRKWLFDGLHRLERAAFFPECYRQQASLAESDLVNWLAYPSELGRPPDEIELVQAVPFHTETDAGWADYFLFRFRTLPPHWSAREGWMAGVSGPFLRHEQPTIQALGDTFSAFTPWDRKSVSEHIDDVRELIRTWRDRHVSAE